MPAAAPVMIETLFARRKVDLLVSCSAMTQPIGMRRTGGCVLLVASQVRTGTFWSRRSRVPARV